MKEVKQEGNQITVIIIENNKHKVYQTVTNYDFEYLKRTVKALIEEKAGYLPEFQRGR